MTDSMRVSTICSIRTHMQIKKRPARNCAFFVTSGGPQAERDTQYGTSIAATVTFRASGKRGNRACQPMSALGHKRTLKGFQPMSALPPKADIVGRNDDVR